MEPPTEYLIGVRLHESAQADDYKLVDLDAHVGDLVVVETANDTAIGEVRRPRRELPESKRERLYRRVVRMASEAEVREYRERRERATRPSSWTASGRAGASSAARRTSGASSRSR